MFRGFGLVLFSMIFVISLTSAVLAGGHSASNNALDTFCIEGQKIITGTSVVPELVIHDNRKDFGASKASIDENSYTIHQHIHRDTVEGLDRVIPKIISCKFKSADNIQAFFGDDAAGEHGSCADVNRATFDRVSKELGIDDPDIQIEDDEYVYAGSSWLNPWPYPAVSVRDQGGLSVKTKGMYIPDAWWLFAVPARFKGVHYCHLIAPDYLKVLMEG